MIRHDLSRCVRWAASVVACVLYVPAALGATFTVAPDEQLVGSTSSYVTRQEDTLLDVARDNDLGYAQLMVANPGIDPWLPGAGRQAVLPTQYLLPDGPRSGIVINLAEQRLYYFRDGGREVETYPIGTGADANLTPIGLTRIVAKEPNPIWIPPPSIRAERPDLPARILPGPDDPLGDFALHLAWPTYLLHGTNKPYGVGRHVSHGCIRLYPEDIDPLFHQVSVGTPVRMIEEYVRLARVDGELYLAVYPSRAQIDDIDNNRPIAVDVPHDLVDRVVAAAKPDLDRIDWKAVGQAGRSRNGIPVQITRAALVSNRDLLSPQPLMSHLRLGNSP